MTNPMACSVSILQSAEEKTEAPHPKIPLQEFYSSCKYSPIHIKIDFLANIQNVDI